MPRIVAGLRAGRTFGAIPVPEPLIRRGASGAFHDKGLAGASHHAVIPNANTVDTLAKVWPRLSADDRRLFDVIARSYLAAMMPDFRYRQTTAVLDVAGHLFRAVGRQPVELGWRAAFPDWQPADEKGEDAQRVYGVPRRSSRSACYAVVTRVGADPHCRLGGTARSWQRTEPDRQ